MKLAFALLVSIIPTIHAQIIAHMDTTRGMVNIELHFEETPLNVGNFMTLASGTRTRVDANTGIPTNVPLYVGETFFRTINNESFKLAQTGSGTGSNMGDPGYRIRDEFDDSLRHTGYRVSMGNSGYPNSAGSQIFITGSVTVPQYDDLHTIFGTIVEDDSMTPGNSKDPSDPSSRDVVDAIISAGASKTTITAVSFTREGPEAMSYDENQLELPVVSSLSATLSVQAGASVRALPTNLLTQRSSLVPYRSLDMTNWKRTDEFLPGNFNLLTDDFGGFDSAPRDSAIVDDGDEPTAFYRFTHVEFPLSVSPSSLANKTINIEASSMVDGDYVATIDNSGTGGNITFTPDDSAEPPISGEIIQLFLEPTGNGSTLIINGSGLNAILLQIGFDDFCSTNPADGSVNPPSSPIRGKHRFFLWQGFWQRIGISELTLTFAP